MLIPTMCFYSLSHAKPDGVICKEDTDQQQIKFDLQQYAKYMGYSDNDSAFLIIEDVNSFFDELKRQVPSAVEQNKHNLTNKRYYSPAIDDAPIYFDRIDYDVHQRNELFDEYQDPPAELFWKFTEYAQQAEVRIIISHWNFIQEFNLGQPEKYQPEQNYLKVNLPNLHSYARCFVPSEYFLEKR